MDDIEKGRQAIAYRALEVWVNHNKDWEEKSGFDKSFLSQIGLFFKEGGKDYGLLIYTSDSGLLILAEEIIGQERILSWVNTELKTITQTATNNTKLCLQKKEVGE